MRIEEATRRIRERMTADERVAFDAGCQIVDWLMNIATDPAMPKDVRADARSKLSACALRQPNQTVQDVIGPRQ